MSGLGTQVASNVRHAGRVSRWLRCRLVLAFLLSLCSVCASVPEAIRLVNDGAGFELSGRLRISVPSDLCPLDAPQLERLSTRIVDFTGYSPEVVYGAERKRKCIKLSVVGLDADWGESRSAKGGFRIQVSPEQIRLDATDAANALLAVEALADLLVRANGLLSRQEVHDWYEHQRPGVICRWIHSVPTLELSVPGGDLK